MKMKMRRHISAIVLLAVFLPMLLLSSFHVHPETHLEGAACKECVHHVPHAGHFGTQTFCTCDCVLCQFLTLPFLMATAVVLVIHLKYYDALLLVGDQCVLCNIEEANHLRAPPFLMN